MRVIAAVRNDAEFVRAVKSGAEMIFDLSPCILDIEEKVKTVHNAGRKLFIHIDLAEGIGKDRSGIEFVKRLGVDGIISTRVNIIKLARGAGLMTVQRFFIVDSRSVETTAESIKASKADMIEIMPGTVFKVIKRLKAKISTPIIAGGLIESEQEILMAAESGAFAISTGKEALWSR